MNTPRTEAEREKQHAISGKPAVSVEFARDLERELATAQERITALELVAKANEAAFQETCDMLTASEAAREKLESERTFWIENAARTLEEKMEDASGMIRVADERNNEHLATIARLEAALKDCLSRCPDCGGTGSYLFGAPDDPQQQQCQWCDAGLMALHV